METVFNIYFAVLLPICFGLSSDIIRENIRVEQPELLLTFNW
jgi:hypothetical protein